jgi:DNA primase
MSQLDYRAIRQQIDICQVLELLHYQETTRRGHQLRGRCLLASREGHAHSERCFCVHLERDLFYCFLCCRGGNQLDLWAAVTNLPFRQATLDLCRRLDIQPARLPSPQP